MANWVSSATTRLGLRQWLKAGFVVLIAGVAASGPGGPLQTQTYVGVAALFALVYAVPHAANRIIEQDRDGRLDHLRLSGQPPAQMLSHVILSFAGPWLIAGFVAFLMWPGTRDLDAGDALMILALFFGSSTLSLLALALPRGHVGADARLVGIALVVVAMAGASFQVSVIEQRASDSFLAAAITRPQLAGLLIVFECIVGALCLRTSLRTIARPAPAAVPRGRGLRLIGGRWNPEMRRALALCTPPAAMIAVMAMALLLIIRLAVSGRIVPSNSGWLFATLASYLPLVVGAFVISVGARADRNSGRFDLMRMAPERPSATLLAVAVGVCFPFVAATAVAHGVAWLLWGQAVEGLSVAVLVALVIAPITAVEGWHGAWPFTYTMPALLVTGRALSATQLWPFAATTRLDPALALLWVPWFVAVRLFRRPDAPPLAGWTGAAFAVCLAIAGVSARGRSAVDLGPLLAGLLATAAFTVDRGGRPRLSAYAPALGASVATAVIVSTFGRPLIDAAVLALAPAAAWWIGRRIHQLPAAADMWSTPVRVFLALVCLTQLPQMLVLDRVLSSPAFRDPAFPEFLTLWHAAMSGLVLALAAITEVVYRMRRPRP